MANSLDDVLDGNDSTEQHVEEVQQVEENQTQQQESALQTDEGNEDDAQTAPTAESQDANGKHVPLAALEAERKQRQDYKEKAARYEGELKALREERDRERQQQSQQYALQQPHQPVEVDPVFNLKCEMSEEMLRAQIGNDAEVDATITKFEQLAQKDPALFNAMRSNRHPWKYAYEAVKRHEAMSEIGTDPAAYRAKIESEIREQLQAETKNQSAPVAAKPNLLTSLAGARSSAGRNAANWTGPTPLDQIFN